MRQAVRGGEKVFTTNQVLKDQYPARNLGLRDDIYSSLEHLIQGPSG